MSIFAIIAVAAALLSGVFQKCGGTSGRPYIAGVGAIIFLFGHTLRILFGTENY
jgi:hypothetical protein